MKKSCKRIFAILIVLAFVLSSCATLSYAVTGLTATVGTESGMPGESVKVDVLLSGNTGLTSLNLSVAYSELLTLTAVEFNSEFGSMVTAAQPYSNPQILSFISPFAAVNANGVFATLTFRISDEAADGDVADISLTYNPEDVIDGNDETIPLNVENGKINIFEGLPGDINKDGKVTNADAIALFRYVAGWKIEVDAGALDCNGDGSVNNSDAIALFRYLAHWPDVKITRGKVCIHNLTKTEANAATCTEDGNIAYWYCSLCEKYFGDENATQKIAIENTIVEAKGHNVVIDPAVAANYEHTGLTEGSHCSVCKEVLVKQEVTPKLVRESHSITYNIANGDMYLAAQNIENANKDFYYVDEGLTLKNISCPGYNFLGWYDLPSGSNAEIVKKIAAGEKNDVELFAHWEKIEYTVQYKSDVFIDKQIDTYTVDKGLTLNTPRLSNYIFSGWADDNGNLYGKSTIPIGTIGNITLTANWTSERNKTFTKPKLDEPIIVEENNMILFTYEIGEIQNVPVYTVHDFGYIAGDGITKTETVTYSTTVTDEAMKSFSSSVAKATTESSDWTLSSNWNKSTSLDEEDYTEKGLTKEEAETIAKSNTDTWNVSSGSSGSSTVTNLTENQSGWTNNVKINGTNTSSGSWTGTHENTHTETKNNTLGINAELNYTPKNYNLSLGFEGASVGVGSSGGLGGSIGGEYKHEWGTTDTTKDTSSLTLDASKSRGFEAGTTTNASSLSSITASNTASWNTNSSKGGSATASQSDTVSTAISQKIANTYHYGESTCEGGANSESKGLQQTQTESDEYGSSVKYATAVAKEQTSSWTTQATKAGYHRWVMVNTAHVFAVVGYDMSKKSYFVYTYSVMDDAPPKAFEDYSYLSGDYNDNENGVIPFSVPYEVAEYVAERTSYSDGLKVDQTTGKITAFNGADEYVVIPEYYNIGEGDIVRITGISSTAFKGNENIKAVRLSDFITEIPANAFEGCTSLLGVNGGSITKIGEFAFKGCTSIENCLVDNSVTSLGDNAFEGCDRLLVNAANKFVLEAAANSGAKKIQLYVDGKIIENGENALNGVTLDIPNSTELLIFNGYGYTYPGFRIDADADETVIYKTHFNVTDGSPVQVSSSKLTLNQVEAVSGGWGLVLSADNTELVLQSTVNITTNTDKSVLCKNIALSELKENVDGILKVSGKVYVAGDCDGTKYLSQKGAEIVRIETNEFNNYLNAHMVTFDANGGSTDTEKKEVFFGDVFGTLPTASRTGYTFDGWYTAKSGGTQKTAESIFDSVNNVTLYAHWTCKSYTASWNSGSGYTITVNRTSSPNKGAATGAISSGTTVYYGDVLSVTYSAKTGYTIGSKGATSITVKGNITSSDIYCTATVNSYTATWSTGTGYSITVKRTSSPNKGATTGTISSGSTVYYGDVLSITYTASTGYSIATKGSTSITVTGNVTSSNIYATASANSYAYNIVYKSSNGTSLGTSSATYKFGTTNTISAPEKTGYITPSSQSVKWDATSKTITFTYTPKTVASSQYIKDGWWWDAGSGNGLSYYVTAEIANRTASSVQIRIVWKQSIKNAYYGYNQTFAASVNGWDTANTGTVTIATTSTWPSGGSYYTTSKTVYSGWMTVPVSATTTSVSVVCDYHRQGTYLGSIGNTVTIPAY